MSSKPEPEKLFIEDLSNIYKKHNTSGLFSNSYLVGTRIYKGKELMNEQQIHLDKSLVIELRDKLISMELDKR
jgi:hypothetical protein